MIKTRKKIIEQIRQKFINDRPSIGTWQQIPNSSIAEILGQAGYDWVAVDMEHGSISLDQLPDLFRALELGNTLPLARIAESTKNNCKQALDAGAGGIIAPMIENAAKLIEIKDACCWPPSGTRGVGYSRANLFGKYFEDYVFLRFEEIENWLTKRPNEKAKDVILDHMKELAIEEGLGKQK